MLLWVLCALSVCALFLQGILLWRWMRWVSSLLHDVEHLTAVNSRILQERTDRILERMPVTGDQR